MAWYRAGGGGIKDGNNISYPVPMPSQENKGYKEASISAIANAIGAGSLTVAQMPSAIAQAKNVGLDATYITFALSDYTVVS